MEEHKVNGHKIAMLRERRGWSQRQLGELVGLSQAGVNTVEKEYRNDATGVLRSTSVEKFIRLGEVFNVNLDYLADRTEELRPVAQLVEEIAALKKRGIVVVPTDEEQAEILRCLLDNAHRLPTEELRWVNMLLRRLGDTTTQPTTAEASEAARIIDHLPNSEREAALGAVRGVEEHLKEDAGDLRERMNYLLQFIEDSYGIDARSDIERRFNVRIE